jgi:hypothetical protein
MQQRLFLSSALTLALALSVLSTGSATQIAISKVPATADELEERAKSLLGDAARYSEAARLYRESAQLRAESDPRAVEALTKAAHLYHYANRLFDARKAMEQAARLALANGDVLAASTANVEAALFAHKQGKQAQADRLGRTALKLAASPLLTADQRASIVGRLKTNPSVAAIVE